MGLPVMWAAGGALLCENALRVPQQFRPKAPNRLAVRIAGNAEFLDVGITADDGAELKAWWFEPENAQATVVLLHGVTDTRQGMMGHAKLLLQHGFRVLAPDSRGHGESGGEIFTYGLREVEDMRRWVEWVNSRHEGEPVYGLGESMGASILLQAAGQGIPFQAIVAESPFATFQLVARYRMEQRVPWFGPLLAETALLYARWRLELDLREASPLKAMGHINIPVLLIHGTADTHIPIEHSRLLAAANPARVELWAAAGITHTTCLSQEPAEFERRVVGWFGGAIPDTVPGQLPGTLSRRG